MKLSLLSIAFIVGCSNANVAALQAWSKPHKIVCYSGGVEIYNGESTGKIENESSSDGYYFQDSKTHLFVTVSAQCVITVEP